jgi:hypothetical protein
MRLMIAGGPIAHPIFQPVQQWRKQSKQKTKTENKETAGCETCQYKTGHINDKGQQLQWAMSADTHASGYVCARSNRSTAVLFVEIYSSYVPVAENVLPEE